MYKNNLSSGKGSEEEEEEEGEGEEHGEKGEKN